MAMNKKTALVTGFEPFGGEIINASQEIARELHGSMVAGHEIVGAVLPCVLGESIRELKRLMRVHRPTLVICVGQAGGRAAVTPERVAINLDDARIADNRGGRPIDTPIVRRGPAAYFSTLPVKAIVAGLRSNGLPAEVSQSAGSFVCNHVFYGLMHALAKRRRVRGGFIHVPFLPKQAGRKDPSLKLDQMVAAIAQAAEISLTVRHDLKETGGQTH
jgi:pyroglutamyl-peptidase